MDVCFVSKEICKVLKSDMCYWFRVSPLLYFLASVAQVKSTKT